MDLALHLNTFPFKKSQNSKIYDNYEPLRLCTLSVTDSWQSLYVRGEMKGIKNMMCQ